MKRPAVFLDRDGTLIRDVNYIARPEQVELLPGVVGALKRLADADVPLIVITNQSGIARGYYAAADFERVEQEIERQLRAGGVELTATYMCPHHPDFTGACECRKPGTLLYRQAAAAHGVDLATSWYIGDRMRDVLPARAFGGRGILVPGAETPADDRAQARTGFEIAASLDDAASRVLDAMR